MSPQHTVCSPSHSHPSSPGQALSVSPALLGAPGTPSLDPFGTAAIPASGFWLSETSCRPSGRTWRGSWPCPLQGSAPEVRYLGFWPSLCPRSLSLERARTTVPHWVWEGLTLWGIPAGKPRLGCLLLLMGLVLNFIYF